MQYGQSSTLPYTHKWLYLALEESRKDEILNLALSALAITRLARETDDGAILSEGRKMYTSAIARLSKAVTLPDYILSDAALATTVLLALFEVIQAHESALPFHKLLTHSRYMKVAVVQAEISHGYPMFEVPACLFVLEAQRISKPSLEGNCTLPRDTTKSVLPAAKTGHLTYCSS